MTSRRPPAAANWILKHLTPGDSNEALAGDLLEEFHDGRTTGWYWSQALSTVALGWLRKVARSGVVAFSVAWSMIAPLWFFYTDRFQNDATVLNRLLCKLPFPLSTVGYFTWWLSVSFAFAWAGIALFNLLGLWNAGNGGKPWLGRKLLLSFGVYVAVMLGLSFLTAWLLPGHGSDRRTMTPSKALTDLSVFAIEARLSCLVTVLGALWSRTPRPERLMKNLA